MQGYAVTYVGFSFRAVDNEEDVLPGEHFSLTQPDPPAPTFEDYVAMFTPGLQQWMEDTAKSNAYDSLLSCVSYKDSGVAQFADDAAAMITWRDAVWKWASAWQAGFNGQLPPVIPTLQEVIAMAPQPEDFGWVVHAPGQIIESQLPPVADA